VNLDHRNNALNLEWKNWNAKTGHGTARNS